MRITTLPARDSRQYAQLVQRVIRDCKYYSPLAKRSEIREHLGAHLPERRAQRTNLYLAAYTGNQLCGFCFGKEDAGTFWLEWFGVAPEYRRRGVGRALLQELATRVKKRGLKKLCCDSRTNNQPSIALLRSMKFTKVAHLRNHWYGHDFFLWTKAL